MDFNSLNHWQQLAFCTAIAERCFPNYALFCEIESTGDAQQVRKMLNKVWEYLRGQLKSTKNIEKQLEAFDPLMPDTDASDHLGAYLALDMTVALQSCLQSIIDNSILDAEAIAEMTNERLKEVIEVQGDTLDSSELWLRHMEFESKLIEYLKEQVSHAELIKRLIPFASDGGVSQVGVCLDED